MKNDTSNTQPVDIPETRSKNNSKKTKRKKGKKKLILKIFLILLFVFCFLFISAVGLFMYYAKDAPTLNDSDLASSASSKIFAANGEVIYEFGGNKRELIAAKDIPETLIDAVTSIEDRRFYNHAGIDPIRIIGAAFSNLKGNNKQGGSTLTQQLIKLSYFSTEEKDQTLRRKSQEAWLAIQLERTKSKEEILAYYINKVYMSNGIYGMETASETFYGKNLQDLSLPQIALLAGLPQAPVDYDPYTYPEDAKQRRDLVLSSMYENKKISEADYKEAAETPVTEGLLPLKESSDIQKITDNYIKEVLTEAENNTGTDIYASGLDIYTNLDLDAQKYLYDLTNSDEIINFPDDKMQVACTVIDVKTGQVKAQIGSRKVSDDVQLGLNLATTNKRYDVGSTMKPIADYAPAIEYLNYSTGTQVEDNIYYYKMSPTQEVRNYDGYHKGTMSIRQALVDSRNVPAVKTLNAVGIDKSKAFLDNLGVHLGTEMVESSAISGYISSLDLAAAYAAFADNGVYHKPYYINKIVFPDGIEKTYESTGEQAMKDSTAYMMTDMLKDVITSGTGSNAIIPGMIQAGKTGTSNYRDDEISNIIGSKDGAPDITFVGYTTNYSISVWTGYDKRLESIATQDQSLAAKFYREMMAYMMQNLEITDWIMPSDVIRVGSELYVKGHVNDQNTYTSSTTQEYEYQSEESDYSDYGNYNSSSSENQIITQPSTEQSTSSDKTETDPSTTIIEPNSSAEEPTPSP